MKPERELERHNRILEQIRDAKTIEELPKIGPSSITTFIANNANLCGSNFSQTIYQPVTDAILEYGTASNPSVLYAFIKVVEDNGPDYLTQNVIITEFNRILGMGRIDYILIELGERNKKIEEFNKKANKEAHKERMAQIAVAFEIADLPKVGLSELNRKILRCFINNDYSKDFKVSDIRCVTEAYLRQASTEEIVREVYNSFSRYVYAKRMVTQIIDNLANDETIRYTVDEINAKEKRKLEIYKENHDETMENIKNAKRISQLPPKLSISTLNKYLLDNSTIYTNNNLLDSEDLKPLVDLLMDGKKWEDNEVKDAINEIANEKYFLYMPKHPGLPTPGEKLYDKLSKLPRTYYLVDEIRYAQERQKEFIRNQNSNVNAYFIPNDKTPVEGGRFYNCYINRRENIDLDALIPPNMDIDAVEWYVQEHIDDTFKTAGGIILNKDETIGNVSVFRPNDGTIGISPEDKAKMDRISDLDKAIEEKQKLVQALDAEIASKKQTTSELESKIRIGLINYEKSVLEAQRELVKHMTQLKTEYGVEETTEEISGPTYGYDKKD